MPDDNLTKLKTRRGALNQLAENHTPLACSAAIETLCAYVFEYGMTEDDLFAALGDPEIDYEVVLEPTPVFWDECVPDFEYEDTFNHNFIEDLTAQRDALNWEIEAIRRETIEQQHLSVNTI